MKGHIYTISLILIVSVISSCDYLNVEPEQITTEENVWNDIDNAEQVLARLYNALPNDLWSEYHAATDMSKHHWENTIPLLYNYGSWSPTNNPFGNWGGRYQDIRRATLFMKNIDNVPYPEDRRSYYEPRIPRYKAEARFLRAMFYFELFKRYGPVPITFKPLDVSTPSSAKLPRNSVDEVVEFIVGQCDTAAAKLPENYSDAEKGRITKGAALALKSRTLLYAASPLFNGNTLYSDVTNSNGEPLFPQAYDNEKWMRAANAAKEVLDLGRYQLYNPTPENPVNTYAQLFYTRNYSEFILPFMIGNNRNFEQHYLPNGSSFGGYGKYSPFQELVDAYEMDNGYPISDPNSGYTSEGFWDGQLWDGRKYSEVKKVSNMYKNRDPRFYATIFFNRSVWTYDIVQRPAIFSWVGNNNGDVDGWPKAGTNSESGYNIRKFSSPEVDLKNGQGTAQRNYPIFRLAEIYLNYAEAMNEYLSVPDQRVYDAINMVRKRVNMPELPIRSEDQTKEGMRKRIHNERRIELAFENHRFWDVRRWMIAKRVDNGPVHGLNSLPSQQELEATEFPPDSREAGEAVFYREVEIQNRVFEDKHYLMPIPKEEIDKNPNMVQNYGW